MNYPSINDIIHAISKEERFTLFGMLNEMKGKGGNQNEKNELEISDDETLLMLNRIKELNQLKFSEFLRPILIREKERVFSIEDNNCANNSSISIIIPYISKQERYNLFIIVDRLLKGNSTEKAKALDVEPSVYEQYMKRDLFCWDNVPGIDNNKLKNTFRIKRAKIEKINLFRWNNVPGEDETKFKEFLEQKYHLDWIKKATFERMNYGSTIKASVETNYLSLTLNNDETKVSLKIDDGRNDEFIGKKNNHKRNRNLIIYEKNNDGKTITIKSTNKNFNLISLRLNEDETKVRIDGFPIDDFIAEKINDELKIYRKNLEISDDKTILLLNLLNEKNPKELTYKFLPLIVFRAKKRITIIEDCLNSGLDFNIFERLYKFHQRFVAKTKEIGF